MASLFLDTSNKVTFGVLGDDLNWLKYYSSEDLKASKVLHSLVNEALEELGIELKNLNEIFYLTGPGSYTGVRVAQGFAEILQWQGHETYSCRHFDIPALLGKESGVFVSRAFKQETFFYEWENAQSRQGLMPEALAVEDLKSHAQKAIACYTSEPDFYKDCVSTYDLIQQNPQALFGALRERKMKSEVFYYRDLEEEFSRGK